MSLSIGDIVALKPDRVSVQLLSDFMENRTDVRSTLFSGEIDTIAFRRGEVATVVEISKRAKGRIKVLYKMGMWWGNISDMINIGSAVSSCDKVL